MSTHALEFQDVKLNFGKREALSGASMTVPEGSIVGLVGRNGAGKTTALRVADGLLHADSGRVRVFGLDPAKEGLKVRERVSLLSEESALYPWMRVGEILDFASTLYPRWSPTMRKNLTDRLELNPKPRVGTLSRGGKAKVALVVAAAAQPDLLLLDDPTAGLDPLVRREVLEGVLEATTERGGTVVYASHLIHDVERVADRIAYLDGGQVPVQESVEGLKQRIVKAGAVFENDPPDPSSIPGLLVHRQEPRWLDVVADTSRAELDRALRGLGALRVEFEPMSLEDILVALLQRKTGVIHD